MFEEIFKDLYLLKVPFGDAWTGVVLVDGEKKILIDSGSRLLDCDEFIIPALNKLGYKLEDITYLTNTHSHGDHIGSYYRIKELCPSIKVVASESDAYNVENPAAKAISIRTKYPKYSPAPQSYLQGVKVDIVLKDYEYINDRICMIQTPGHDKGCVCLYDKYTNTIISGDSIQGNGTPTQGVAFYQSLDDYRHSMHKLLDLHASNIICGHDYDKIGAIIKGEDNVKKALELSLKITDDYQKYVDNQLEKGINIDGDIAVNMINDLGCGMPPKLFMAVYTVNEHINKNKEGK